MAFFSFAVSRIACLFAGQLQSSGADDAMHMYMSFKIASEGMHDGRDCGKESLLFAKGGEGFNACGKDSV